MTVMDWEARADRVELETRWESSDGSRWRLVFQAVEIGGRLEPVGMDIRSWPRDRHAEPHRLLRSHLRELRLAYKFQDACEDLAKKRRGDVELMEDADIFIDSGTLEEESEPRMWSGEDLAREIVARKREAETASKRARSMSSKQRFGSEDVEHAAKVYLAAMYEKRHPQKAVREEFGITPGQASSLIRRCRLAGLLPPTRQGVARGWEAQVSRRAES